LKKNAEYNKKRRAEEKAQDPDYYKKVYAKRKEDPESAQKNAEACKKWREEQKKKKKEEKDPDCYKKDYARRKVKEFQDASGKLDEEWEESQKKKSEKETLEINVDEDVPIKKDEDDLDHRLLKALDRFVLEGRSRGILEDDLENGLRERLMHCRAENHKENALSTRLLETTKVDRLSAATEEHVNPLAPNFDGVDGKEADKVDNNEADNVDNNEADKVDNTEADNVGNAEAKSNEVVIDNEGADKSQSEECAANQKSPPHMIEVATEFDVGQEVEYWSSTYNKWAQEKNNQPIQVLQKRKTKRRGKTVTQYRLSVKPKSWIARLGDVGEERIRAVAAAKTRVAAKSEKSQTKPRQ
jgi:hypothetical protein